MRAATVTCSTGASIRGSSRGGPTGRCRSPACGRSRARAGSLAGATTGRSVSIGQGSQRPAMGSGPAAGGPTSAAGHRRARHGARRRRASRPSAASATSGGRRQRMATSGVATSVATGVVKHHGSSAQRPRRTRAQGLVSPTGQLIRRRGVLRPLAGCSVAPASGRCSVPHRRRHRLAWRRRCIGRRRPTRSGSRRRRARLRHRCSGRATTRDGHTAAVSRTAVRIDRLARVAELAVAYHRHPSVAFGQGRRRCFTAGCWHLMSAG
jgi:hypothetical protein